LRRRYESLTGKKVDRTALMQPGGKEDSQTLSSDLQGSTVLFTWDNATGDFKASLLDGKTKLDLGGLDEDMDLRVFLPGKQVAQGDTWSVDASAVDELFSLGGDLGLEDEEGGSFEEQLAELLEGDIEVAYVELDDSGAAVLRIKASLDFDGEITDQRIGGTAMKVNGHINMRGNLLWNVKAGHFQSFELEVEMDLAMKTNPPAPGASVQVEMDMALDMRMSGRAERQ
jgi:hypothetical protein